LSHASSDYFAAPVADPVDVLAGCMRGLYGLSIEESARANLATALAMAAAGRNLSRGECVELARRGDEQLLQTFVQAVTIHETYFFRHPDQFELVRAIARERLRDSPRATVIRALSAGCASGEEAYSLAIALFAAVEGIPSPPQIEVLGIDIDRPSIEKACGARYGRWAVRDLLPIWSQGSIVGPDDAREVAEPYRGLVRFRSVNLHDPFLALLLADQAPFDFIFCRNVLMYLVPTAIDRVVRHLFGLLSPIGYLTFSPTDLHQIPKLLSRHPHDPTFLSRADRATAISFGPGDPSPNAEDRPADSTPRSAPADSVAGSAHLGQMLANAKSLIDAGDLTPAKALCSELLRRHPDVPAALYLAGLAEMESGLAWRAEKFLLEVLDRQPDFALAHFVLSTLLKREGRNSEARARLVRLSHLLEGIPNEAILAGPEEITCGWLRSVVNDHLNA
jgi:chemotaxis protein methyltransferase CheR